ncbi:hypothetical protein J6590_094952 [Homalodisca vitripennis]|nr:hypothetical protein J6590_094952 [Homalodisca vitripennis]
MGKREEQRTARNAVSVCRTCLLTVAGAGEQLVSLVKAENQYSDGVTPPPTDKSGRGGKSVKSDTVTDLTPGIWSPRPSVSSPWSQTHTSDAARSGRRSEAKSTFTHSVVCHLRLGHALLNYHSVQIPITDSNYLRQCLCSNITQVDQPPTHPTRVLGYTSTLCVQYALIRRISAASPQNDPYYISLCDRKWFQYSRRYSSPRENTIGYCRNDCT